MGPNAAMRRGRWKLVRRGDAPPELYDLAADAGETTDLAADKPKLLEQLSDALAGWESQLVEPVWGTPIRPRASGGGRVRRRRQPQ
jgi:arylsulfatase A-like enzyme